MRRSNCCDSLLQRDVPPFSGQFYAGDSTPDSNPFRSRSRACPFGDRESGLGGGTAPGGSSGGRLGWLPPTRHPGVVRRCLGATTSVSASSRSGAGALPRHALGSMFDYPDRGSAPGQELLVEVASPTFLASRSSCCASDCPFSGTPVSAPKN